MTPRAASLYVLYLNHHDPYKRCTHSALFLLPTSVAYIMASISGLSQRDILGENKPDILDWFVRIRTRRKALGVNYTVLIYLGEPPASPDDWRSSPNQVGSHAVLSGGFGGGEITEGFAHLNKYLDKRGVLSKSEEDIEAHIKENIDWRILKVSKTVCQ